jgi:TRAP-type C4-dicarboxylate transport system permease small subunit
MKERSFVRLMIRILTGVGALALVVMTLWTVVDVITRYALSKPLKGSIDLVESTLVLVVFLALPACFLRDEQVTVDVFDNLAPPRVVEGLKLLGAFATMLFLLLLGYTGLQPMLDAWQFGDQKPDLPIPIYALLGVIEVAIVASVVVLVGKFLIQMRRVLSRETN